MRAAWPAAHQLLAWSGPLKSAGPPAPTATLALTLDTGHRRSAATLPPPPPLSVGSGSKQHGSSTPAGRAGSSSTALQAPKPAAAAAAALAAAAPATPREAAAAAAAAVRGGSIIGAASRGAVTTVAAVSRGAVATLAAVSSTGTGSTAATGRSSTALNRGSTGGSRPAAAATVVGSCHATLQVSGMHGWSGMHGAARSRTVRQRHASASQPHTPRHPPTAAAMRCAPRPAAVLEHLRVLQLPATTQLTRLAVKSAFHQMAMRWHPGIRGRAGGGGGGRGEAGTGRAGPGSAALAPLPPPQQCACGCPRRHHLGTSTPPVYVDTACGCPRRHSAHAGAPMDRTPAHPHPCADKHPEAGAKVMAEAQFKRCKEAYENLVGACGA